MAQNTLEAITRWGQSLWYDHIQRGLLTSGELARLIAQGIRGVTSNPTIFEKAINGTKDYDQAIQQGIRDGLSAEALYDALTQSDIIAGADLLRPIYDETKAQDGYISLEVPPDMADDTASTIAEAHRLAKAVNRPNLMIKVPATPAGIPAIRQLIADGINVNVTLIFSIAVYQEVMEAYLQGLEERLRKGLPLSSVASVASFFVSRVDTLVDRLIDERKIDQRLKGRAAIANAKMAYQAFRERFQSPRFQPLKDAGAQVQRPLWASTSTKNPDYPDLLYVEALIGPDTVDTLPPQTVAQLLDHGTANRTLDQGLDDARAFLSELEAQGISMDEVTDQLQREGVRSFKESFVSLMQGLTQKRTRYLSSASLSNAFFGAHGPDIEHQLRTVTQERIVERIWQHDPSVWKETPEHQTLIENALGWLTVPEKVMDDASRLESFARSAAADGFTDAVVLGMGGSSLVSDVLRSSFGPQSAGLRLHVLDTTNPEAVHTLEKNVPLEKTLFIVASKSGTTTEPNAFYRYFWHRVDQATGRPSDHFIAITDPGTQLAREAQARRFREIFLNPADIGGRYSALSWFGMVPASLAGIDIRALLSRALTMSDACREENAANNPGAWLGTTLGTLAQAGLNKVTLMTPPALQIFPDWVEQLLAESTGKEGTGLVPITHEPLFPPESYSPDRIFVVYSSPSEPNPAVDDLMDRLRSLGHPIIRYSVTSLDELGAEFFRWEFATAVAGHLLKINAFDQPNVQESKDNTKNVLAGYAQTGQLPDDDQVGQDGEIRLYAPSDHPYSSSAHLIDALLKQGHAGDYVAIMAYLPQSGAVDARILQLRRQIGQFYPFPTTLGYGPRFLHSTGQLHKGGKNQGLFIQLVAGQGPTLPIPEHDYDFLTLIMAQAAGDYQSLKSHHCRVIRMILPDNYVGALDRMNQELTDLWRKDDKR